ncbi:small ubiquitin-related modifier 3-like, partial [Hippocampus comes]|uniref:Ubiquitin-like domain-containing protein n=1 Tax=Hippocampus comes TaxID=109280 RepID=A0A3Q2ZNS0_HIPCM
ASNHLLARAVRRAPPSPEEEKRGQKAAGRQNKIQTRCYRRFFNPLASCKTASRNPRATSEEKPKEGVKTENDHINLKVAGQDGSVVQFKIKRHTPLSKLMKAYCERQGLSIRQIRFRFDGQPINETDTPSQLEMEDEDTIDVFQQQTGGRC